MVTDPIADFITRIKNAGRAGQVSTAVPASKVKLEIARALVRAGFLKAVDVADKSLELTIAYTTVAGKKVPKMDGARRISKVSRRMYTGAKELKPARQGYGVTIISTTKGILTDKEAKKEGLGGEVLLTVW